MRNFLFISLFSLFAFAGELKNYGGTVVSVTDVSITIQLENSKDQKSFMIDKETIIQRGRDDINTGQIQNGEVAAVSNIPKDGKDYAAYIMVAPK